MMDLGLGLERAGLGLGLGPGGAGLGRHLVTAGLATTRLSHDICALGFDTGNP